MAKGLVYIYYSSDGRGQSPAAIAAIGRAVQAAIEGKHVVIIQFQKGKGLGDFDLLGRMEPEIKLFRFEKSDENLEEFPEDRKQEEIKNIKNGISFAKKVLATGECDLLILDEVLGLVEKEILSVEDVKAMLECREDTSVILTGVKLDEDICALADEVSKIETPNKNPIFLDGYICKEPIYRKTPLGKEIADLLLAVNRPYGKSYYISCICWGRNAHYANHFKVGERCVVWGSIRSREYMKKLDEENVERRVAFEVAVSKLELVEESVLPE